VTPPVAPAAAYGAALAKSSYFRTALESSKLCVAGFLVPYMMVFFPPLLLDFSKTSLAETIIGYASCVFIILTLQISFVGYFVSRCRVYQRLWAAMTTLIFFRFLVTFEILTFLAGVFAFLGLTLLQVKELRSKMPKPK
jgi:TRAP-type uncharacterized transport system fused permease subunit